jgi:hypothetical protein
MNENQQSQLDRIEAMLQTLLSSPLPPNKMSLSAELNMAVAQGRNPLEYLKNKYRNKTPRRQK